MKHVHAALLVLAAALVLPLGFFGTALAQQAEASTCEDLSSEAEGEFSERVQQELEETVEGIYRDLGVPGVLVGIWVPGVGSWTKSFGVSNLETGEPLAFDQHVRIGSITKTFTGTLILQLAEEGLLSLDDPVSLYFGTDSSSDKIALRNEIPYADEVTLRNLLNMTSGIASYTFDPDFLNRLYSQPNLEFDPVELVNIGVDNTIAGCPYAREEGLEACFEPGTNFFYSNTNTVMLGLIVEHVTGKPYGEVLQEKVLEPLGLEETSHPTTGDLPIPYARGYTSQGLESGQQDATHWNPTWAFAVGDLISTFDDLRKWGCALGSGELLSDEMQAERLTEVTVGLSVPGEKAYALAIGNNYGWWGHEGTLPGYNTLTYYRPDIGAVLVVIANGDNGGPAGKVASAIIDIAARESPILGEFEEEVPYDDPSLPDEGVTGGEGQTGSEGQTGGGN